AFTLFEIAISLGLLTLCVTGVILVFPVAIKTQEIARFKLLACAKAEEMIDCYNNCGNQNTDSDAEAGNPWDVPSCYRSMAQDLECRLSNPIYGALPVPRTIATRLDSDRDEIHDILAEGGNVYYSQPM